MQTNMMRGLQQSSTAVPQTEDDAVSVSSETDRRPSSARQSVTHVPGSTRSASGRRLIMDPEREGMAAYSFAHDDDSYEVSGDEENDPVRMAIANAKRRQIRRRRGCMLFLLVSGVTMIVLGITLGLLYGPNHEQRTGPENENSALSSNPYDLQNAEEGEYEQQEPPVLIPPEEGGSTNTGHLYVVPKPTMDLALICNEEMFSNEDVNAVVACRTECEPGLCCWLKDPLGSCYDWGETNSIICSQYYEPCILLDDTSTGDSDVMTAETDGTSSQEEQSEKDTDRPVDEGFIDPDDLLSNPPIIDDDIWRDGRQDAKWTLLLFENFENPTESLFQPGYVLNGEEDASANKNEGEEAEAEPDANFFIEDPSTLQTPEDSFTHSGVTSVMIRDHEEEKSSVTSITDLDLTPYGQIKIKFWFKGGSGPEMTGMEGYYENGGYADSFFLEYSADGGVSWDALKEFEAATDDYPYNGGYGGLESQYTMSRLASEPFDFTNQARFRFRANANGDNDQVFIDDIEISGGPPEDGVEGLDPISVQDVWTPKLDNEKWAVLTYDHFEYGFDDERCNFVSGGKDTFIYGITPQEGRALYVNSGSQSVRLQDDNDEGNSCFYHKNSLDATPYAQLRVRFWFVGDEIDEFETDNNFSLDYSSDGGDTWLVIKEYWFGSPDFYVSATPQEMVVVLDRTHTDLEFTENAKFRFASHGNSNGDAVYIDDVEVCGGGDGSGFPVVEQVSGVDDEDENDRPEIMPEMIFWDTGDDTDQPLMDLDGGQWEMILYDDFESSDDLDSSNWVRDDGDAVRISTSGPPYSNSGSNSVRLSDKTDFDEEGNIEEDDPTLAYFYTKSSHDITPYNQIRILFWFIGSEKQGFEDEEFFILEYSGDNGKTWNEVKRWVRGSNEFYKNAVGYLGYAYMNASDGETNPAAMFTPDALFRFHSFAGGSNDRVYIDDIYIAGNEGEPVIGITETPEDLSAKAPYPIWSEEERVETTIGEGWTILFYDDFEGEQGFDDSLFEDGGEHVRLYDDGRPNCNSGTHSVRLQEDASEASSLTLKQDFDASPFKELRVRFWFRGRGDNSLGFDDDDSFGLEVSSDSAQTWTLAKEWAYGSDDFEENGVDYLASQLISNDENVNGGIAFTPNMRIRFRAMSKDDQAKVFLDDIELVGR